MIIKIEGSKNVLLLIISGSDEITIDEIGEINEHIQNETGNNANIIMGVGEDLDLGNNISVTIIATGFGDEKQKSLVNTETKKVIYTLDEDHPFERELIEDESYKNNEMIKDKFNKESSNNFKQKKIESEINEILRNIEISKKSSEIPFCVFKLTGIARFELLEKLNNKLVLSDNESKELDSLKLKLNKITRKKLLYLKK